MISKTELGKTIRRYFIECENKLKSILIRDSSKETRRTLTDVIKDSGENERQRGHAYSNYTKLIYKKLGIDFTKQSNFRDTLSAEQLKAIENLEKLAEAYIRMGYDYYSLKNVLPECILEKSELEAK